MLTLPPRARLLLVRQVTQRAGTITAIAAVYSRRRNGRSARNLAAPNRSPLNTPADRTVLSNLEPITGRYVDEVGLSSPANVISMCLLQETRKMKLQHSAPGYS